MFLWLTWKMYIKQLRIVKNSNTAKYRIIKLSFKCSSLYDFDHVWCTNSLYRSTIIYHKPFHIWWQELLFVSRNSSSETTVDISVYSTSIFWYIHILHIKTYILIYSLVYRRCFNMIDWNIIKVLIEHNRDVKH
jgi:hypothetical protein